MMFVVAGQAILARVPDLRYLLLRFDGGPDAAAAVEARSCRGGTSSAGWAKNWRKSISESGRFPNGFFSADIPDDVGA